MAIEVRCRRCGRVWNVSVSASGSYTTCHRCHTRVRVPRHVIQRKQVRGFFGHEVIEVRARRKGCLDTLLGLTFLALVLLLIAAAFPRRGPGDRGRRQ